MKLQISLKWSLTVISIFSLLEISQNLHCQNYAFDNAFNFDGQFFFGNQDGKELFTDMALQADGKIVLIGRTDYDPDEGGNKRGFVLRLKPNGTLDSLFGVNGVVYIDTPDNSDEINAMEVQPDGKILIAGATELNNNGTYVYSTITRLESNGTVDLSFGNNGVVLINSTVPSLLWDIELDTDGKIVGSGFAVLPNQGKRPFITRLNADGMLDTTFAGVGYSIINDFGNFEDAGIGVAIQADHKIVVVNNQHPFASTNFYTAVFRMKSDGSLDTGYGPNGNGFINVGEFPIEWPTQIDIDNLDNVVIGGYASDNTFSGTSTRFTLRRLKPNGNLDLSFDTDGKANYDPHCCVGQPDNSYGMQVMSDGSILLAGSFATKEISLVKFKQDGSLDSALIWQTLIGVSGALGEVLVDDNCIYIAGVTQLSAQSPNDDDAFCGRICTNTVSTLNPILLDDFVLTPNPTSGELRLNEMADRIVVYDLLGKPIKTELNSNFVNLNSFEGGIYLVSIEKNGKMLKTQKILLIK